MDRPSGHELFSYLYHIVIDILPSMQPDTNSSVIQNNRLMNIMNLEKEILLSISTTYVIPLLSLGIDQQ